MNRKFASVFLLTLASSALLVGQTARPPWKEYVYPDSGFAITLPSQPSVWKDPTRSSNIQYTVHPTSDIVFGVLVESEIKDCPATLADFRDSARKILQSSVKDFVWKGDAGYETESEGHQGDRMYGRYFCVNGKFYGITATWPADDSKPAVVPRIMDSFRILNADARN